MRTRLGFVAIGLIVLLTAGCATMMGLPQGSVQIGDYQGPFNGKFFEGTIEVQVYRSLLESQASEMGARMTAMDSATRNARDLIGKLTLKFNKQRQAAITKEISEIVGGAEALK